MQQEMLIFESYKTADTKFDQHHEKFPEVYEEFCKLAFAMINRGHKHYGAKGIMEVVRWHKSLQYSGREFKISNNHTSRYSRKFMKDFPEHAGFFKTKELRS